MSSKNKFNIVNLPFIMHNGRKRNYNIILPENPAGNEKHPLVIALHGFGGNSKSIEYVSQLSTYVADNRICVVYPNGYANSQTSVFYSWNAGFCCGNAYRKKSDDVGFIKTLILSLLERYPLDKNKILVTGISNGAMLTHRIGVELGDLVKVIVPIAGSIGGKMVTDPQPITIHEPRTPISVMLFHGTKDNYIPYYGGEGKRGVANFISFEDSTQFWVKHNKCSPEAQERRTDSFTERIFTNGLQGTNVIQYTVINGTHSWPGGKKGLQSEGDPIPPAELCASKLMIDFLKSF